MIELEQETINKSLELGKRFNETLIGKENEAVDLVSEIIQGQTSPLTLSHAGIVLTPRIWDKETKIKLACVANTARLGLAKVADYLAVSDDHLAAGIRHNMLGGVHFNAFEKVLKAESKAGISSFPFEVGRADIINGGALEVNCACLDAPIDFHDLSILHKEFMEKWTNGRMFDLSTVPEKSIVELIIETMVQQCSKNGKGISNPIFAWLGTAAEVYGSRADQGYWPREFRFRQAAQSYLDSVGFKAEFKFITIEQLSDPKFVSRIGCAYRNLLPEDMNPQSEQAIAGLSQLAATGRLSGSITAELITNKAAMAVITSRELSQKAGIPSSEWSFYAGAFPSTAFLSSEYIYWNGELKPLKELVDSHKEELFFKTSNGEEGKGVWAGSDIKPEKLTELIELSKEDPYSVIVQKKMEHIPFNAAVIDLTKYKMEIYNGFTDMGTHYQLLGEKSGNLNSNIIMTRFTPSTKSGGQPITNSDEKGIFRPVSTYINNS